jgi:hypothetical protein
MRIGVLVAAGAAGLLTSVTSAQAAPALMVPVADTYVSASSPAQNFGTADSLRVSAKPFAAAYLRFRVAVPAGQAVSRATLQVFASSRSAAGFKVQPVASTDWSEKATDYKNLPPIQHRVVGRSGPYPGGRYVSVDVTSLVTRSGVVSLALTDASAVPLALKSREAPTGRPRLVLETVNAFTPPVQAAGSPCGTLTGPPRGVDHVIWIWMENKSFGDVIGSALAPFENQLAAQCGLATNYHAVTHPSLPNYIAATSGGTQGIADDGLPSSHPLDVSSIYSQLDAVGKTWRDYAEGAPGPCPLASSGAYAVRHDPAAYYTGIRADCAASDIPMGTTTSGAFVSDLTNGTLPAFSFVTPDLDNDTHDSSVATGDAWLQSWLTTIAASKTYRAGRTVVFVVWDEDDGSSSNQVPLLVMSASTARTQSASLFDHYSLLKTTEQLLGLPFLGQAGAPGTASMLSSFNLG